jgi:WD40 repeat protein
MDLFFYDDAFLTKYSDLKVKRRWKLSGSCYDYCFYPYMNSSDQSSCCFITAIKDNPVQLWDIVSGRLRASYLAPDHVEVIRAPNSIAFSLDGNKIFCGYTNRVNVFQTGIPGSTSDKIATTSSRKAKDGLKGIVSSISFNPDGSGIFAVGTFSGQVGLYDERDYSLLDLKYLKEGISQIEFSKNGKMIITASRKSNEILVWDLRNTGQILFSLKRDGYTNQRLKFSLDSLSGDIGASDINGNFTKFNLLNGEVIKSQKLYDDVCSSVSFHPFLPLLASTCGERRISLEDDIELSKKVGEVSIWREDNERSIIEATLL